MRFIRGRLWRDETGTVLPVFLLSLPFAILGIYLPLYARELGASAFQVGALFTAFSLAGVLARPLVGLGADRFGRRPFILAGVVLYLLSAALFAASFALPVLFAARLTQGIGSALFWVAISALLADYGRGSERGQRFGRLIEKANAGAILGAVAAYGVIALLGITTGWRVAFGAFTATTVIALVLFRRSVPARTVVGPVEVAHSIPIRTLLFLLSVSFLVAGSYSLVAPIILLYLRDRFGATELQLGIAYAPAAFVLATAPGRFGSLGDRWSRKGIMAGALMTGSLVALLLPLAGNLTILGGMWTVEALLVSAALPAQNALVSDLTGGDVRGAAYGLYSAATGLGAATGPLVGGWLYDNAGPSWQFRLNAMILSFAAVVVAWKLPQASRLRVESRAPERLPAAEADSPV